jgi:hypothetical protein
MTTPDWVERGLDPAHILGITNQATRGVPGSAARAVPTADGYRLHFRSRRAARDASGALRRVGYQVSRGDEALRRDVLVSGWSTAGLESRLAVMRTVAHQLEVRPAVTAGAVIDRVRSLTGRSQTPPDTAVVAEARTYLRSWVSARSGIHAPHNPAIMPGDRGNALRLSTAWVLESVIDELIERHVVVARHALSLYGSLRHHMPDDLARSDAIRRADVNFYLKASPVQDSSSLLLRGPHTPLPGLQFSWPDPGSGATARPARLAASGFPRPIRDAVASTRPPSAPRNRPGGRHFPAGRLGPHR